MRSMVPSLVILGTAAIAALILALRSDSPPGDTTTRRRAAIALAVAASLQCIHFIEEAATGFSARFPALLGLPPMQFPIFVAFNLFWLGFWFASIPGLRAGRRVSLFAAWFLALAGTLNGVAHPAMALATGGYFPGVISAPFVAIACIWLWSTLLAAAHQHSPFLL